MLQDDLGREALVAPQERVQAVRPFWETVLQEERQLLLTASVEALRERAKELAIRQRKQAGAAGLSVLFQYRAPAGHVILINDAC